MRRVRKRFLPPVRSRLAVKTVNEKQICLQNAAGRHEKKRRMGQQWVKQKICPRCNQEMRLVDCQFERQEFEEDVENLLIHKRCR